MVVLLYRVCTHVILGILGIGIVVYVFFNYMDCTILLLRISAMSGCVHICVGEEGMYT